MAKRILVVDDEFSIYQMTSTYLNAKGYETFWAKNGQEGYEKFLEELPDLVIADVLMPKLNGAEMLKKIRGRHEGQKVPIIMMTSIVKSFKLASDATGKWGANAYLQKPIELDVLLKKVREFIGEGQARAARVAAIKDKARSLAFRGTFEDKSYARVLHTLSKRNATGKLELTSDRKRITVYVEEGRPVDIRSNYIKEDSLTQILKKRTSLDDAAIGASRSMMKTHGLQQGEALVALKSISKEQLGQALREQSIKKLLSPFSWKRGSFTFIEGLVIQDPDLLLDIPTPKLFLMGISEHYPQHRIRERLGSRMEQSYSFDFSSMYKIEDFDLSPQEREVVTMAENRVLLSTILERSKVGVIRTHQILYALFLLGICKFEKEQKDKPPKETKPEPPEIPQGDPEFFFRKGREFYNHGDYRQALDFFEKSFRINNRIAKYNAWLGLTLYKVPQRSQDFKSSPEALITKAASFGEACAQTDFGLGLYFKEKKQFGRAKAHFEATLELEPDNPAAQRELHLINIRMRRDAMLH